MLETAYESRKKILEITGDFPRSMVNILLSLSKPYKILEITGDVDHPLVIS
jgi:hypothetical protein